MRYRFKHLAEELRRRKIPVTAGLLFDLADAYDLDQRDPQPEVRRRAARATQQHPQSDTFDMVELIPCGVVP